MMVKVPGMIPNAVPKMYFKKSIFNIVAIYEKIGKGIINLDIKIKYRFCLNYLE